MAFSGPFTSAEESLAILAAYELHLISLTYAPILESFKSIHLTMLAHPQKGSN